MHVYVHVNQHGNYMENQHTTATEKVVGGGGSSSSNSSVQVI
jgi:hypothetical protein